MKRIGLLQVKSLSQTAPGHAVQKNQRNQAHENRTHGNEFVKSFNHARQQLLHRIEHFTNLCKEIL
jgi:hypothetical protein